MEMFVLAEHPSVVSNRWEGRYTTLMSRYSISSDLFYRLCVAEHFSNTALWGLEWRRRCQDNNRIKGQRVTSDVFRLVNFNFYWMISIFICAFPFWKVYTISNTLVDYKFDWCISNTLVGYKFDWCISILVGEFQFWLVNFNFNWMSSVLIGSFRLTLFQSEKK